MAEVARTQAGEGRYFALMLMALVGLALLAILNPARVGGQINPLFTEDGPIEMLSALGYFACAILLVARGGVSFAWKKAFWIIIILLFLASRELDFHTRFTTMGVMKINFYQSDEVPLMEKLEAALVLGLVGWAAVSVIFHYGRAFLNGLRGLEPASVATAISLAFVVLSKGIDGMDRKFALVGIDLGGDGTLQFLKFEETMELGVPLFAIIAAAAYFGLLSRGAS